MIKLPWRKREKGWSCTRVQQYWDEYAEGELSVRDQFEYEAHLAKCQKCQDFIHFLKYEHPAIAGVVRAAARARVAGKPVPQKVMDAAMSLSIEERMRLIQFVERSEEERRLTEEKRRRREMERERMEKAKPN